MIGVLVPADGKAIKAKTTAPSGPSGSRSHYHRDIKSCPFLLLMIGVLVPAVSQDHGSFSNASLRNCKAGQAKTPQPYIRTGLQGFAMSGQMVQQCATLIKSTEGYQNYIQNVLLGLAGPSDHSLLDLLAAAHAGIIFDQDFVLGKNVTLWATHPAFTL